MGRALSASLSQIMPDLMSRQAVVRIFKRAQRPDWQPLLAESDGMPHCLSGAQVRQVHMVAVTSDTCRKRQVAAGATAAVLF